MQNNLILFMFLLLLGSPAYAEERPVPGKGEAEQQCKMQETAQAGINFNNINVDPAQIQTVLNEKIAKVKALAAEAGIEDIQIESYSYNVYNNAGNCSDGPISDYQFSGNVNFNVKPIEKAPGFHTLLSKNGFSVNLNVNGYKQCQ